MALRVDWRLLAARRDAVVVVREHRNTVVVVREHRRTAASIYLAAKITTPRCRLVPLQDASSPCSPSYGTSHAKSSETRSARRASLPPAAAAKLLISGPPAQPL